MDNNKKLPARITPSSIGKSTLSFLLDFVFCVGSMFILFYAVMTPAIINNNDFYPAMRAQRAYIEGTELLDKKDEDNYAYKVFEDKEGDWAYAHYIDVVWNFFTVVLPANADYTVNVTITSSLTGSDIPAFDGAAKVENVDYMKWLHRYYFGYVPEDENVLFAPSVPGDFSSKPAPTGQFTDVSKYHSRLLNAMYNAETSAGHYPDVISMLNAQPKLAEYGQRINLARYAGMGPAIGIPPIIFFFILPLCIPNGKTLGKLICGVAVIGADGYSAPKGSILIRQAIITLIWMLLALPWQVVGWPLYILLMLIGYMSHVMSKKSQAFHDKLTHTLSVDSRKSVWFATPELEAEFVETHPTSPIAKQVAEENDQATAEEAVTSAMIEAQERILDLSTINKRREEARNMTSFNEFERQSDADFAAREEEAAKRAAQEEPVDPEAEKAAMRDAALMEGLSEEEAAALMEAEDVPEEEEDVDPDGFTDEGK